MQSLHWATPPNELKGLRRVKLRRKASERMKQEKKSITPHFLVPTMPPCGLGFLNPALVTPRSAGPVSVPARPLKPASLLSSSRPERERPRHLPTEPWPVTARRMNPAGEAPPAAILFSPLSISFALCAARGPSFRSLCVFINGRRTGASIFRRTAVCVRCAARGKARLGQN